MSEFRMPSLGADMEAGKLVEWLKHPGERVHRGDIIAVVETQKGAIEVEIFQDGVLQDLLVDIGATVPVGAPLALISDGGGAAPGAHAAAERPSPVLAAALSPPEPAPAPTVSVAPATTERPRASPAARRLAEKHGIPLTGLHGTGPDGAVISTDVERAMAAAAPKAAPKGLNLAEMRRAIAAAMARSKRDIPHFYLATTIDITETAAWLARTNADRPPARRLLLAAPLLKAVAAALREIPEVNGFYTEDGFVASAEIHLGVAIAIRGGGLIAPALHNPDRLTVDELMERLRDLTARARTGALRSSELTDPTITVTSLGERGVESVFGVIYPPQVALVGLGTPVERPWVVDGAVVPRRLVTATLSADHRASDGHRGALFLAEIDRKLQTPETL